MMLGNTLQKVKEYYRVKADINLDAIAGNAEEIKKKLKPGVKLAAVIKADGYGHGAVPVAKTVYDTADWFAVSNIEEALELREAGIKKPILTLGYTSRRPSGLRKTRIWFNSLAHRTTWLRSDLLYPISKKHWSLGKQV